jgi:hypothetical protein
MYAIVTVIQGIEWDTIILNDIETAQHWVKVDLRAVAIRHLRNDKIIWRRNIFNERKVDRVAMYRLAKP